MRYTSKSTITNNPIKQQDHTVQKRNPPLNMMNVSNNVVRGEPGLGEQRTTWSTLRGELGLTWRTTNNVVHLNVVNLENNEQRGPP